MGPLRVSTAVSQATGRFFGVSRSCARPGCGKSASATLSYAYSDSIVVLEDLAAESHPMVHDLCNMHASNVRVPMGWSLNDVRNSMHGDSPGDAGSLRLVGA